MPICEDERTFSLFHFLFLRFVFVFGGIYVGLVTVRNVPESVLTVSIKCQREVDQIQMSRLLSYLKSCVNYIRCKIFNMPASCVLSSASACHTAGRCNSSVVCFS